MESEPSAAKRGKLTTKGIVKVAKYYPGKPLPFSEGFTNIHIHTTAAGLGGQLSPYVLRDENGVLLENKWQFSKVYPQVSYQHIKLSNRYPNSRVIWNHPAEGHIDIETNQPTAEYWAWREKGYRNEFAIRYPNGFEGRSLCIYSLWPSGENGAMEQLDYIQSRKKIYCGEYVRLCNVGGTEAALALQKLKDMLNDGTNLQIIEVDGPDPSLTYAPYDRISKNDPGLVIDEPTIRMLINDKRKPFGHGYVIAAMLLDGSEWMK